MTLAGCHVPRASYDGTGASRDPPPCSCDVKPYDAGGVSARCVVDHSTDPLCLLMPYEALDETHGRMPSASHPQRMTARRGRASARSYARRATDGRAAPSRGLISSPPTRRTPPRALADTISVDQPTARSRASAWRRATIPSGGSEPSCRTRWRRVRIAPRDSRSRWARKKVGRALPFLSRFVCYLSAIYLLSISVTL